MPRLITLPNKQTPPESVPVAQWTPGGTVEYSDITIVDLTGSVTCENDYTIGAKTTDGGRGGDIYTSSGGFTCNVYTKSTDDFYTNTYIGSTDIPGGNNSFVNGNTLVGSKVKNTTMANWTKNVKGFVCEVSSSPVGSGDASDGSGTVESMGVSAVYADSSGAIKVFEMNNRGTKIFGHTQNSRPPGSWTKMCYVVNSNASLGLYHMGWIVSFHHKKFQGGATKSKNCTGRIRYLQPIISSTGGFQNVASEHQLLMRKRKWEDRDQDEFFTV